MRFSWTGLILAPLLVPIIFSAVVLSLQEGNVVLGFLVLMVPTCIISYGTTVFSFCPHSISFPYGGR